MRKFKILIADDTEETSTTISYHEDKHSAEFTTSGCGNYIIILCMKM